jgi:hypothetical protein
MVHGKWSDEGQMRELVIEIRLTDKRDWFIEINGRRYEHISAEIMEELVVAAVIETEMMLTELSTETIQ